MPQDGIWKRIATATKTALFFAGVLGLVLGLELGAAGGLLDHPIDSFVLILYVSMALAVALGAGGLLVGVVSSLLTGLAGKEANRAAFGSSCFGAGVALIVFSQAVLLWTQAARPVPIGSPATAAVLASLLGVSVLCGWGASRLYSKRPIRPRIAFAIPGYLAAAFLSALVASQLASSPQVGGAGQQVRGPGRKVILIGVDAATWDVLDDLRSAGKLLNLSSLVRSGACGDLESIVSAYSPTANSLTSGIKSPAVWTSILTGKSPHKHGIKDFTYTSIPGIRHPFRHPLPPFGTPGRAKIMRTIHMEDRPFTGSLRKTKAIWNMLSDSGKRVACLGWFCTWPAEKVNGVFVSDRLEDSDLGERWYPDDLLKERQIEHLMRQIKDPDSAAVARFTAFDYNPAFRKDVSRDSDEYTRNLAVSSLIKTFYMDGFRARLGLDLMGREAYDFFSVFLYGLDVVGHNFWKYMDPGNFEGVTMEDRALFGGIIEAYYEHIDRLVGEYLDLADRNTVVVIVSDHGMGPWMDPRLGGAGVLHFSGNHRRSGIIILAGPGIRQGAKLTRASLLDVTPTILYLMGFPVARDMDGRVLAEAIEPALLEANPITYVATYETGEPEEGLAPEPDAEKAADKRLINRLKALGYVN